MRRWYYAVPLLAAGFLAACSPDSATNPVAPRAYTGTVTTGNVNLGGGPGGGGPLAGAVYTSLPLCSAINHNIYNAATDVYVNGGPAGNTNLTDGPYYVAVTDPAGNLLGWSSGRAGTAATPLVIAGGKGDCLQLWAIVDKASSIYAGSPATGFDASSNGVYKVWISTDPAFESSATKTDNFKVSLTDCTPNCGPTPSGLISVYKFYDSNGNGVKEPGEPYLDNWEFQSTQGFDPMVTAYTSILNPPTFEATLGATYTFQEGTPNPVGTWHASTATTQTVTPTSESPSLSITFGNFCTATGNGSALTLGAYSGGNKTYTAFVTTNLSWLITTQVSFFNAGGSNVAGSFTGSKATANFQAWLTSANANNMANMLSAQLATMWLNSARGVTGYLYAPQLAPYGSQVIGVDGSNTPILLSSVLTSANVIPLNALLNAATYELAQPGANYTVSASTARSYEEALKTVLDNGNNNRNWLAGSAAGCGGVPAAFTFPSTL